MTKEAQPDRLERQYGAKFRSLAATYGVEVKYERDRGARDFGLHLFRKRASGVEHATGSLVWFQFKGIGAETVSKRDFKSRDCVPVRLRIEHLRLWHRMNGPTYLIVYVESVDQFFILDLDRFVSERFPNGELFKTKGTTVTACVPKSSIVDKDVFELLLRRGSFEEWKKVFGCGDLEARLLLRDFRVIWLIGTAKRRGVTQKFVVTDWQSKLRGEIALLERVDGGEWNEPRHHLQFLLGVEDVEEMYPYLDFAAADEEYQEEVEFFGNEDSAPAVTLKDGSEVFGRDAASEYNEFELTPTLNALGRRLFDYCLTLIGADILDEPDAEGLEILDIAPWNRRII